MSPTSPVVLTIVSLLVLSPRPAAPHHHGEEAIHLARGIAALSRSDLEEAMVEIEAADPHGAGEDPLDRFDRLWAMARICNARRAWSATAYWVAEAERAARAAAGSDTARLATMLSQLEGLAPQDSKPAAPVTLGEGTHRYTWVTGWGRLPEGLKYGNTHGAIAFDGAGNVYVNTDGENAILVFKPDGTFVRGFGKEFAGGLHGMVIVREGEQEVMYLAHHGRHQAYKATLDGKVLLTIDWPQESKIYKSAETFRPTSVAVGPDGTIFVADGYGQSWVHRFDKAGKYLSSFGGPGSEPGKFQTPHGLLVDTRGKEPVLLVADRENHRIQSFTLDGKPIAVLPAELRRPCKMSARGTELVVADLAGRVSILGADGKVICHLGDQPDPAKRAQNGVPPSEWRDGEFISPHAAAFDGAGNIYVMDWLSAGRITKLSHVD